tara:strand:+ start:287 stop:454 length:168 start_codon:yes stop_codon:yes gene_type:complete
MEKCNYKANRIDMKKFRQYRSNQGRNPEKMKYSYVVVFIGIVGIIVGISCMLILK